MARAKPPFDITYFDPIYFDHDLFWLRGRRRRRGSKTDYEQAKPAEREG